MRLTGAVKKESSFNGASWILVKIANSFALETKETSTVVFAKCEQRKGSL